MAHSFLPVLEKAIQEECTYEQIEQHVDIRFHNVQKSHLISYNIKPHKIIITSFLLKEEQEFQELLTKQLLFHIQSSFGV